MVSILRAKRISDRIYEELSLLILHEINDPRISSASITDVIVDKELAYADVYVSSIGGHEEAEEILEGFENAKGFIRSSLARRINIRSFPSLRFHWDPTPEQADNIDKILAKIKKTRETKPGDDNDHVE